MIVRKEARNETGRTRLTPEAAGELSEGDSGRDVDRVDDVVESLEVCGSGVEGQSGRARERNRDCLHGFCQSFSVVRTTFLAPILRASSTLSCWWVKTVTSAPMATPRSTAR